MFRNHRLPLSFAISEQRRWLGAAVIGLALAGLVAVILMYVRTQSLVGEMESAIQEKRVAMRRALVPAQLSPIQLEQKEKQAKLRNEIDGWLLLPWDDLLREFETNLGPDVTLLALEPDVASRTVALTAEARDLSAMLDYADSLAGSARFDDVYVKQHEVLVADPQKPVRFVISLRWLPDVKSTGGQP